MQIADRSYAPAECKGLFGRYGVGLEHMVLRLELYQGLQRIGHCTQ